MERPFVPYFSSVSLARNDSFFAKMSTTKMIKRRKTGMNEGGVCTARSGVVKEVMAAMVMVVYVRWPCIFFVFVKI